MSMINVFLNNKLLLDLNTHLRVIELLSRLDTRRHKPLPDILVGRPSGSSRLP